MGAISSDARIFVAGHKGMVGSALVRRLNKGGYTAILTRDRKELDLMDQRSVFDYLDYTKPDFVFIAAAKVGGIAANNTYRADFLHQNLVIECNLIHGAHRSGVQRLCFLGSSCIYPRDCPQPMKEEYLLSAPLEPTNEPYAIAKIAGVKLCENYNRQYGREYFAVMPTNLYGPGDNYDIENSHVLPAMIRKMHEGKNRGEHHLMAWGSGRPLREFLYSDDLADACVHLMEIEEGQFASITERNPPIVNIGSGKELSIRELAELIREVVGFPGAILWDTSKPDGAPRKLLDCSRIRALGWEPHTGLEEGIHEAYKHYLHARQEAGFR